jgi:hypothetical protein
MKSVESQSTFQRNMSSSSSGWKEAMQENQCECRWQVEPFPTAFTLVSCLAYASTLKMEATCSHKMAVDFQRTTWRYIPEDKAIAVTGSGGP